MAKKIIGQYGVLASDGSPKELTLDYGREIEARLVTRLENSQEVLTIVSRLNALGNFEVRVENENRQAVKELHGNLYEDTGHQRSEKSQEDSQASGQWSKEALSVTATSEFAVIANLDITYAQSASLTLALVQKIAEKNGLDLSTAFQLVAAELDRRVK